MLELKGRKVLVLGLGDTGWSMTRWLVRQGASVRVADTRMAPPHAASLAHELPEVRLQTGPFGEDTLGDADLVAISPGIDRRGPPASVALKRGVPVVGDIELFAQALDAAGRSSRGAGGPKVLAVTGSNGKSTVTAMTGGICRAAGLRTMVAGNIGLPALDALQAAAEEGMVPEIFVLELSSFQLESTSSLNADAAAMLNLCEDHLDRYPGLAEYAAAKARIFEGEGVQVLNRDDGWSMSMARAGRRQRFFGRGAPRSDAEWGLGRLRDQPVLMRGSRVLMAASEMPVAGLHNALNALAALALADAVGLEETPSLAALKAFKGLPHRLQKVAECRGVTFYNDSKGTNVGATVAALSGLPGRAVLIAGGDGKGQDFAPLAPAVSARARAVVLLGRDAGEIANALTGCSVPVLHAATMEEAVEAAFRQALPGDAVLLSPACASYDMFHSYAHRGDVFAAAVRRLTEEPV
jgi:UDP-N-acetylmuramoylalanine--D-glutamate ligase